MRERILDDFSGVGTMRCDPKAAGNSIGDAFASHSGAGKARGGCQASQLGVGFDTDSSADPGPALASALVGFAPFRAFHDRNLAWEQNSSKIFLAF